MFLALDLYPPYPALYLEVYAVFGGGVILALVVALALAVSRTQMASRPKYLAMPAHTPLISRSVRLR